MLRQVIVKSLATGARIASWQHLAPVPFQVRLVEHTLTWDAHTSTIDFPRAPGGRPKREPLCQTHGRLFMFCRHTCPIVSHQQAGVAIACIFVSSPCTETVDCYMERRECVSKSDVPLGVNSTFKPSNKGLPDSDVRCLRATWASRSRRSTFSRRSVVVTKRNGPPILFSPAHKNTFTIAFGLPLDSPCLLRLPVDKSNADFFGSL